MELWSAERVCIKGRFERDWGILVDENGMIQSMGPRSQLVAKARTVNHYSDHLLLPAFVNPHHFGYQRLFRGITNFSAPFQELKEKLVWPLSMAVDAELLDAVYRLNFAEQALSGIATVGEFFFIHNGAFKEPGSSQFADRIIKIACELGIRLTLVYTFFDQGTTENTKAFIQPLDLSLKEFHDLRERYKNNALVHIIPGIHGFLHTSTDAIVAAGELADQFNTKLHVQFDECEAETECAKQQYGTTPLRALEKLGLVRDNLVIINGNNLDEEELKLLVEAEAQVIICPSAALLKGEEFPNTYALLKEQVPFAVGGKDISLSHTYSVPNEINLLEFSQRSLQKTLNVLSSQTELHSLWDLGSATAAEALGLGHAQLMPGTPADFMLVAIKEPYFRPNFSFASPHYMNQLLHGWGSSVEITHLLVQGRLVVDNGQIPLDLEKPLKVIERWSDLFLRLLEKSSAKASEED